MRRSTRPLMLSPLLAATVLAGCSEWVTYDDDFQLPGGSAATLTEFKATRLQHLKLRGLVKRVLVIAPKGLLTQWVVEMRTHFNEDFRLLIPLASGDYFVDALLLCVLGLRPWLPRLGGVEPEIERKNREGENDKEDVAPPHPFCFMLLHVQKTFSALQHSLRPTHVIRPFGGKRSGTVQL